MNTAKSVLDVARSQIGVKSGKRYWDYVQGSGYISGSATPWCACFVSWCFHEAKAKCAGLPSASCTYGIYVGALKARAIVKTSEAKPGDVILFNFDKSPDDAEHTGIIEVVHEGYFTTIEGNTNAQGSSTGGQVARKVRPKSNTFAIIRPSYDLPENAPSKPTNNAGLRYRAHVQGLGWLPAVHDGMIAGTVGESLRLEALKFTPPAGVTLTVNAHIQGVGWVSYDGITKGKSSGTGSSKNDPIIGSVGQNRRLEAVQIHADGLPAGKRLRYRAHVQGKGWLPWQASGKTAGTTGEKRRMEALQVEII